MPQCFCVGLMVWQCGTSLQELTSSHWGRTQSSGAAGEQQSQISCMSSTTVNWGPCSDSLDSLRAFPPLDLSHTLMCCYTLMCLNCCVVREWLCRPSDPPFCVNIKLPTHLEWDLDTHGKLLNITSSKAGEVLEIPPARHSCLAKPNQANTSTFFKLNDCPINLYFQIVHMYYILLTSCYFSNKFIKAQTALLTCAVQNYVKRTWATKSEGLTPCSYFPSSLAFKPRNCLFMK